MLPKLQKLPSDLKQIQAAEASGGPKPDKPQPFTPQEVEDPTIGTVEILYDFETSEPEEHESDAEWEENEAEEVHEPAIVAPRYCFVRVLLRGVRYLIELYQPSSGKVYRLETYSSFSPCVGLFESRVLLPSPSSNEYKVIDEAKENENTGKKAALESNNFNGLELPKQTSTDLPQDVKMFADLIAKESLNEACFELVMHGYKSPKRRKKTAAEYRTEEKRLAVLAEEEAKSKALEAERKALSEAEADARSGRES